MKLFAQIAKVDEEKRLVFGRAAEEKVDKADEVMDYLSSKPHFQKWSADIAADTDGKNLGNVRAMHGKVAAGALTAIDYNDAEKAIDVVAHIVDDQEWNKVLKGVYTGFSIGGSYVGEKKVEKADGRDVTRYTAKPSEISLVDRPCMGGAKFFDVQKADGSLSKVEFAVAAAAEPEPVEIVGSEAEIVSLGKLMNESGMSMAMLLEKVFPGGQPVAGSDNNPAAATSNTPAATSNASVTTAVEGDAATKIAKMEAELTELLELAKADPSLTAKATFIKSTLDELKKPVVVDLEKVATDKLAKMVLDAVTAATEPLTKALGDATKEIAELKKQPAASRISLRAVAKADDLGGQTAEPTEKELVAKLSVPIVDDIGEKHEAAGLIKGLHAARGAPLHAFRKTA